MSNVAIVVATQPHGKLPPGPALFYGFSMIAICIGLIVFAVIDSARERRRRGPTPEQMRKQQADEAFTRALIDAAREPAHHSIPERYRSKK